MQTRIAEDGRAHDGVLSRAQRGGGGSLKMISRDMPQAVPGVLASLVERADRLPILPITDGRRKHPVGCYYSMKCGYSLPWESRGELHGMHHAEVDVDVVRYRAQPHRLDLLLDGEKHTYVPDREDLLADGSRRIVEVKSSYLMLRDTFYEEKLETARAIYEKVGWSFEVAEASYLQTQPLFDAVDRVQSYRRTAITTADIVAANELFALRPDRTWGEIEAVLGPPPLGFAKLCRLVVERLVRPDLSRGLHADIPVRLVADERS